ncbi:MAG TPA: hypothetical protein VKU01_18055 [Bryobacteraceae bacterium]|nr:hypothetical protein [Bryobacteraceae bacterium]
MLVGDDALDVLCLPGRAEAETAIAELLSEGRLSFVLVVVAKHVHSIYETQGFAEGDALLEAVVRRLTEPPLCAPRMFRWSATSFVVLSHSLRTVTDCSEIEGASCALFAAWPNDASRALFDRIDNYIATHLAYAA